MTDDKPNQLPVIQADLLACVFDLFDELDTLLDTLNPFTEPVDDRIDYGEARELYAVACAMTVRRMTALATLISQSLVDE